VIRLIHNIKYIISNNYDPYYNLALEEYLLSNVKAGECILYLWQNEKTVVIGKNQNPFKECKIKELTDEGGRLVRRLSGGGAVFHDFGNLNFTFLVQKKDYDLQKQLAVIIKAVSAFGITADITGRNDITVEGKKISGNAFYTDGTHSYHHGTILINVNMEHLSKYLTVSKDKLISKGVDSVRSRVTNLKDCIRDLENIDLVDNTNIVKVTKEININTVKEQLIQAFTLVYQCPLAVEIQDTDLNHNEISRLQEKYSSWDWNYGKKLEFGYSFGSRFDWGNIDIHLNIGSGKINQCHIYSDAMDVWFIESLSDAFMNCNFTSNDIQQRLERISRQEPIIDKMIQDVIQLIFHEFSW
jgi:lipoate---protein ligase